MRAPRSTVGDGSVEAASRGDTERERSGGHRGLKFGYLADLVMAVPDPSPPVVLVDDGQRLLIDSAAMAQAVHLYRPLFAADGRIVDLEILMLNDAARRVPLGEAIVVGAFISDVFVDAGLALEAATIAWNGGRPADYSVERSGFVAGTHHVIRYDVSTFRAGDLIVQVSLDRTWMSEAAAAETRFRMMAEASPDGIALLSLDRISGRIGVDFANPSIRRREPDIKPGADLPQSLVEFVRGALVGLHPGRAERRPLDLVLGARRSTVDVFFTHLSETQVMVTVRDLTDEQTARLELERSDELLRAMGVGAFGGLAIFEPVLHDARLVGMSPLWSAQGRGKASGREPLDPLEVFPEPALVQIANSMHDAGERARFGLRPVRDSSGEERSIEFALVEAGDRYVLEFVEHTDELAVRTELAMVTAAAETQRAFLSRVSHELRSPLNVIHGYSQLLDRMRLPGPANQHVERITSGVERMVRVVDDLLLLGHLDQGLVSIDEHLVDLDDVVGSLLLRAREQPWCAKATIERLSATERIAVRVDQAHLVSALVHLLQGSVTLAAECPFAVGPYQRGATVGLQVTAPRASPVVEQLWHPFSVGQGLPGNGLGVAVARGLLRAMGLTAEIREVPGQPTRVALVVSLQRVL